MPNAYRNSYNAEQRLTDRRNLTEVGLLSSFNEKTHASENLSIRVIQVPQYAGGLSDVSNANFISPLKNNKADSIPSLNIFS